jgi:hypothetical protein
MGTPLYMPPEAVTAPNAMDARGDLYALGAVVSFMVTGTHVFSGRSTIEVCEHHVHTKPEPPSSRLGRAFPADLELLLLDCLEKDPTRLEPRAGPPLVQENGEKLRRGRTELRTLSRVGLQSGRNTARS